MSSEQAADAEFRSCIAARAEADAREAEFAEQARWHQLGLLMDLNERFPLPDGMYFDIADDEE